MSTPLLPTPPQQLLLLRSQALPTRCTHEELPQLLPQLHWSATQSPSPHAGLPWGVVAAFTSARRL